VQKKGRCVFEARRKATRSSLVTCGDDSSSKEIAAELIRDVGFDPLDAGPLQIARYIEPFAPLVAQLAYGGVGSPELEYRFDRRYPEFCVKGSVQTCPRQKASLVTDDRRGG